MRHHMDPAGPSNEAAARFARWTASPDFGRPLGELSDESVKEYIATNEEMMDWFYRGTRAGLDEMIRRKDKARK